MISNPSVTPQKGQTVELVIPRERAVIWLHCPKHEFCIPLLMLAARFLDEQDTSVLFTSDELTAAKVQNDLPLIPSLVGNLNFIIKIISTDTIEDIGSFFSNCRPNIGIFHEGELQKVLLQEAKKNFIPLILINAKHPRLEGQETIWFAKFKLRSALQCFSHIFTTDAEAMHEFRKAGASAASLKILGRTEEHPPPLSYLNTDKTALANAVSTRPIWLVSELVDAEEEAIIAAHRFGQSVSHRLLLVIIAQKNLRLKEFSQRLITKEGWSVGTHQSEPQPTLSNDVFISDDPDEFGLWYNLSPITFMGGSMAKGSINNPIEPVTFGSALIHGKAYGDYANEYHMLKEAHASHQIETSKELGDALINLLSPDQAARQAVNAWRVITQGAENSAQVIQTTQKILAEQP